MASDDVRLDALSNRALAVLKYLTNNKSIPSFTGVATKLGQNKDTIKPHYQDVVNGIVDFQTVQLTESIRSQIISGLIKIKIVKTQKEIMDRFEAEVQKITYVSQFHTIRGEAWDYFVVISTKEMTQQNEFIEYIQSHELVEDSDTFGFTQYSKNTGHHELDGYFEVRTISQMIGR